MSNHNQMTMMAFIKKYMTFAKKKYQKPNDNDGIY
jgi:hypothetical protein